MNNKQKKVAESITSSARRVSSVMALAAMVIAVPAYAVLDSFGLIDVENGFPKWYTATDGMSLELCLDPNAVNANDPLSLLCLLDAEELADPVAPVIFPDNFWPEAFWTRVDSNLTISTFPDPASGVAIGGKAILVMALEGAFSSLDGEAAVGENISFARIRVRIDNPVEGANFKITHPYGTVMFSSVPQGVNAINFTSDIGIPDIAPPPTDFNGALLGPIGPFLRWTAPDFPVFDQHGEAYIGDPNIAHAVTGSPFNTNFFRIEGPVGLSQEGGPLCTDPLLGDDPVDLTDCIETDLFLASGKLAVDADQDGIAYTADNCPATANALQEDVDGDGIGNACDNCTDAANSDQRDTNGDGFGNMCDADLDNNGLVNLTDFVLFRGEYGQTPTLGIESAEDADFNGDNIVNLTDFVIFRGMYGGAPGPSALNP